MEALFIDGKDGHLGVAEQLRVVEGANLNDDRWKSRRTCYHMGAAVRAKLARDGPFDVAAGELLAGALGVTETHYGHRNKHIGRAARDVLAFAAMALGFHHRLTLRHVAQSATIATAFQFHKTLPGLHGESAGGSSHVFGFGRVTLAQPRYAGQTSRRNLQTFPNRALSVTIRVASRS